MLSLQYPRFGYRSQSLKASSFQRPDDKGTAGLGSGIGQLGEFRRIHLGVDKRFPATLNARPFQH